MRILVALAVFVTLVPGLASATGRYQCAATDKAAWLTEADLTKKLEAEGWSVRRMKEDGGCWEVYGTTPDGDRVEAYFHPVSGDPRLIAQRGKILFRHEPTN